LSPRRNRTVKPSPIFVVLIAVISSAPGSLIEGEVSASRTQRIVSESIVYSSAYQCGLTETCAAIRRC
jgi:hypothetical protein